MCGIGFLLGACPADQLELETYISALRRRGPDADKQTDIELEGGRTLHLIAAVLHLRGENLCAQPVEDADGNVLLWNGEVFNGLNVGPSESDTAKVLQVLSRTHSHQEVVAALGLISGPFSLVYWCPGRRVLYYGRDPAGRRSLVLRRPRTADDSLAVLSCLPESTGPGGTSSVQPTPPHPPALHPRHPQPSPEDEDPRLPRPPEPEVDVSGGRAAPLPQPRWEEVRADGIYVLDVDDVGTAEAKAGGGNGDGWAAAPCPELYPWSPSLGGGGAEAAPPRVPIASDTPRSPQRRRRRRQLRCAGDSTTTDSGSSSCKGENGGRGVGEGDDGRGGKQERDRVVLETGSGQGGGGGGDTAEGLPATTPEATRVVEGGRFQPDGRLERRGRMRPAPAGLLAKLRDSVHRRVRTVPYPTTPTASLGGGGVRRRRREESSDGTARRAEVVDLQDGCEEAAAKPRAEGCGGMMKAAAVGQQGGGGTGFEDAAATAAAAETGECSRGGNAPEDTTAPPRAAPTASRVGVLFSGGLDSVVLAAMLAEEGGGRPAVPRGEAIDLINVCFDSPSGHQSPDRLASITAADELKSLFPYHVWRLVCVDASYDNVLSHTGTIWRVMQPCTTTMDFNIAAAFWFASRGTGWLYQPPTPPNLGRVDADADATDLHPPHGSTARVAWREREIGAAADLGVSTPAAPLLRPTPPATAAAIGVPSDGGGDDPAAAVPRGEGDTGQISSDTPAGAGRTPAASASPSAAASAAAVRNDQAGSVTSSGGGGGGGSKGKKATKVNKNSAELCPVDGCRRLLRPGCVFDMCSRCCLKAQGLVDAAAAAEPSAVEVPKADREGGVAAAARGRAAAAEAAETTAHPSADTAVQEQEEEEEEEEEEEGAASSAASERRQCACKARAEAEAMRALEARLLDRFGADLSPPFRPDALAALLLLGRYRDRDRGFRPPLALGAGSGAARPPQPIKWCSIHKRPRRKKGHGGSGAAATPGGGGELEGGEEGAGGRRLAGSAAAAAATAAATVTSAARVLLVRAWRLSKEEQTCGHRSRRVHGRLQPSSERVQPGRGRCPCRGARQGPGPAVDPEPRSGRPLHRGPRQGGEVPVPGRGCRRLHQVSAVEGCLRHGRTGGVWRQEDSARGGVAPRAGQLPEPPETGDSVRQPHRPALRASHPREPSARQRFRPSLCGRGGGLGRCKAARRCCVVVRVYDVRVRSARDVPLAFKLMAASAWRQIDIDQYLAVQCCCSCRLGRAHRKGRQCKACAAYVQLGNRIRGVPWRTRSTSQDQTMCFNFGLIFRSADPTGPCLIRHRFRVS